MSLFDTSTNDAIDKWIEELRRVEKNATKESDATCTEVCQKSVNCDTVRDKNVLNVVVAYAERAQKGFTKYGTTTERTDIDLYGWLQHLQEELMDATVYLERIKCELKQIGKSTTK